MRSGVFAPTPARAGEIAAEWLQAETPLVEAEVVDLDEADLVADRPTQRLFGTLRVPASRSFRPAAKASPRVDDAAALDSLAGELAAGLAPGQTLLFGPGTTTARIMRALGIERPSLLGVDAVRDGRLIDRDLSEAAILDLLDRGPATVVAGIVGGQGFLFGRCNQPLSARVLARVGRNGILVVAGLEKLTALEPLRLLVDTGDPEVDRMLAGWMRVAVGPGRSTLIRIEA
jgi:predicted polyphosphate/ATP-dependent NAD kinase